MREGGRLYCRCHRQTCKVCVDQRLATIEATCTRPCSASPKLQNTSKKKGERLHCLLWCLQKTEHQRERERKERIKRFWERRKGGGKRLRTFAKTWREKKRKEDWTSEQEIQKSLKEDLWFGNGVAYASTELDLASTVQGRTVQWRTVLKVMDEIGVKLLGLLSIWLSRLQPYWKQTVS